jgi:hypothetical protein
MCANTFSIAGHGPAYPGCTESYHSHLAAAAAKEYAAMVTMAIVRVISGSC